jgi:hypothetical protein
MTVNKVLRMVVKMNENLKRVQWVQGYPLLIPWMDQPGRAFLPMLSKTNLRKERQLAGITAAKAKGKHLGRKASLTDEQKKNLDKKRSRDESHHTIQGVRDQPGDRL